MAEGGFFVRIRGKVSGPHPVKSLQRMVRQGMLARIHEVSSDRVAWSRADAYDDLFPQRSANGAPAMAGQRIPREVEPDGEIDFPPVPPPIELAPDFDATPSRPPPVAYWTAPTFGEQRQQPPRSIVPFLVSASAMFLGGAIVMFAAYLCYFAGPSHAQDLAVLAIAGSLCFVVASIPTLVLWLMWLHRAHSIVRAFSSGAYSVTPGMAVGLSFVPFFDAFWVVYMPWRLSEELNRHLAARRLPLVSSVAVMICQITSVIAALPLPAFTPALYAVSMWQLQRGLNKLIAVST